MSRRRNHQKLIDEVIFDQYRTSGAKLNEDLHKAEEDIEELKKWHRRLFGFLLLLSLLGLLALLGYGLWIGLYNNAQDGTINNLQSNVTTINNNLMQLILEMNGNVTTLQTGNFSWVIANALGDFLPPCVDPNQWLTQGGLAFQTTYELQNVQIGMLNFTWLVLNPPPEILQLVTEPTSTSILTMCMINFSPTVDILDTFNTDFPTPYVLEFTNANLKRLAMQPNCLLDNTCSEAPYVTEFYTGAGGYSVAQTQPFPNSGQFYLQFVYIGNFHAGDWNFTISESLKLVLPSS